MEPISIERMLLNRVSLNRVPVLNVVSRAEVQEIHLPVAVPQVVQLQIVVHDTPREELSDAAHYDGADSASRANIRCDVGQITAFEVLQYQKCCVGLVSL